MSSFTIRGGLCAGLLGAYLIWFPNLFAPASADESAPNAKSALGTNLSGIRDWSTEMPFVDVFQHARAWISQEEGKPWGKGPALELSTQGWVKSLKPGQYATTLMLVGGGHPAGKYVCLYDGEGTLEFAGNTKVADRSPGRVELDVSRDLTLMLHLKQTDPKNPVRNIRMIMPGFEKTYKEQVFYPPFLDRYRPFKVLRFMDWMETNNSEIREWGDRPTPALASQALRGVSVEYMIDLSNRLHVDPWFCLPHLASDDYVRQFAKLVRDKLDPSLRVYVEHSNEVWNGQFAQARYAAEQGKKLELSKNAYQAQLFYHAQRSVEIFIIWEEVFGGKDRLVRVLGSQSANPWVSEQVTTFRDAHKHADAVAIAPYFGNALGNPMTADEVARMSVELVAERCRQDIAANRKRIEAVVAKAKALDLDVIAYEGGQHLVGHSGAENNEKLMKLFHAANRDPKMKDLYLEDLASWKAAGGKLFVVFSSVARPSKWGSWGMLEAEDQPATEAPKYQAIVEFLKATPRWWDE